MEIMNINRIKRGNRRLINIIEDDWIMASRVAKFEKVSKNRFVQDLLHEFMGSEEWARVVYDRVKLPQRATKFSAGYDFFSTLDFTLQPGNTIKIPTGIRCGMNTDWVLMIYPRSGL